MFYPKKQWFGHAMVIVLGLVVGCGDDDGSITSGDEEGGSDAATEASAGRGGTSRNRGGDGGAGGRGAAGGRAGATGGNAGRDDSPVDGGVDASEGGTGGMSAGDGGSEQNGQGGQPAASNEALTDPQIAAIIRTANMGEIQEGMVASMRAQATPVRAFAQQMVTMHTAALEREAALFNTLNLMPQDNPTSMQLMQTSMSMLEELDAVALDQFDELYMRGQVMVHETVLGLVERALDGNPRSELAGELMLLRTDVSIHLNEARAIAAGLAAAEDAGVAD
jgi:putative membrane protein